LQPDELQSLAEACVGYVPADLQALGREAHLQVNRNRIAIVLFRWKLQSDCDGDGLFFLCQALREGQCLEARHVKKAMEVVGASALRGLGVQVGNR